MTKIKTLSNERYGINGEPYYHEDDIKESINLLKRNISRIKNKKYFVFDENGEWLLKKIIKEINKTFGKKLI